MTRCLRRTHLHSWITAIRKDSEGNVIFLQPHRQTDLRGDGEKKTKKTCPMFLMRKKRTGFTVQETWINDKDWVSPVKINFKKNNTGPIYTRREVSFLLRVTECQMVFELHWHLTESWHHGNGSKEKNTSQVLVDLLWGAQGAFLNICGWLQQQEAPQTLLECTRHVCWVKGESVLQWFSLKMLGSKI